jgi:hypothetical protein
LVPLVQIVQFDLQAQRKFHPSEFLFKKGIRAHGCDHNGQLAVGGLGLPSWEPQPLVGHCLPLGATLLAQHVLVGAVCGWWWGAGGADSWFTAGRQGLEAAMQSGRVGCVATLRVFAIETIHQQVCAPYPHQQVSAPCAPPSRSGSGRRPLRCPLSRPVMQRRQPRTPCSWILNAREHCVAITLQRYVVRMCRLPTCREAPPRPHPHPTWHRQRAW